MSGYTPNIPDSLLSAVGLEAAALACRLASFAGANEQAEVSCQWLCDTYGWSGGSLKKYAKKLDVLQIWHMRSGDGRTHKTQWRKGANFATFMHQKGVKICTGKVSNFATYNIRNKNNNTRMRLRDDESAAQRGKTAKWLPLYLAGDTELKPEMIDAMVMLRYKGKIAYCWERDLAACRAAGAELFTPIN